MWEKGQKGRKQTDHNAEKLKGGQVKKIKKRQQKETIRKQLGGQRGRAINKDIQ
tara:strand:+ start:163 stop:324 length:162 start_codon:yes stop_codon:yes gene_type:complete